MTREKPGCRTLGSVTIVWLSDHRSRRPVLSPLRNCVDKRHVWPNWASRCKPWRCMLKDINIRRPIWQGLRRFEAYCQLPLYDVEKEMQHGWALAAMRAAWVASSLLSKVHCESKKQDTKLLPTTSPNINRFSNIFTDGLGSKFPPNSCLN